MRRPVSQTQPLAESASYAQSLSYLVRFAAQDGNHPGTDVVCQVMRDALRYLVEDGGSRKLWGARRLFPRRLSVDRFADPSIADGVFYLELPATSSVGEALQQARTQESVLVWAANKAEAELRRIGFTGRVLLSRTTVLSSKTIIRLGLRIDHEAYTWQIGRGVALWTHRLLVQCLLLNALVALSLGVVLRWLAMGGLIFTMAMTYALIMALKGTLLVFAKHTLANTKKKRFPAYLMLLQSGRQLLNILAKTLKDKMAVGGFRGVEAFGQLPLHIMLIQPARFIYSRLIWRGLRRQLDGFLLSRPLWTGVGWLSDDGRFSLDRPPTASNALERLRLPFAADPLSQAAWHYAKTIGQTAAELARLDLVGYRRLCSAQQRIVMPLASDNRAQLGVFLRQGLTQLALSMAAEGWLKDAPRLTSPWRARLKLAMDASLQRRVPCLRGQEWGLIDLQEFYHQRAVLWLGQRRAATMLEHELVRVWGEALRSLRENPGLLIGRIDWVSKRYLLETNAKDQDYQALKRIDLGYHELTSGYYSYLEQQGVGLQLVDKDEIERLVLGRDRVIRSGTSALRGSIAFTGQTWPVDWGQPKLGQWWRPRLVATDGTEHGLVPRILDAEID